MALHITSPTENIIVKPSATDNRVAVLGVDGEGGNIKLGNLNINAEMDTWNDWFRMYRLNGNGVYTNLKLIPFMHLDNKMTVTANTNQIIIHNTDVSASWEAGCWIDNEGANLGLQNSTATFETQFDMIGNEARWYRRYLTGTQYYNELRLRDTDAYCNSNTVINGNVYASNIQAKTNIRHFFTLGGTLVPEGNPSGSSTAMIGSGEIDFNTMSVRIKGTIWWHGVAIATSTNFCQPYQFLTLLGLSSNYEVDTSRLINGRSDFWFTNYELGYVRWNNPQANASIYQASGPYIIYSKNRSSDSADWIKIGHTAISGADYVLEYLSADKIFDSWGISVDFTLPIKEK